MVTVILRFIANLGVQQEAVAGQERGSGGRGELAVAQCPKQSVALMLSLVVFFWGDLLGFFED